MASNVGNETKDPIQSDQLGKQVSGANEMGEKVEGTREACYQPLKDPVYENYTMISPEGKVLCRCGKKKVNWYLSRGLATVLESDPSTIQLNFTPGGHGEHDDEYQLADKHNHCVVCGRDDYNTKHHIVEYEYRQHMPLSYKSHNSYDLMILCGPCHTRYEIEAMQLKNMLAKKYDAPVNGKGWYYDPDRGKVKKAAKALLSPAVKMIPDTRVLELKQIVKVHLELDQGHELSQKDLEVAFNLEPIVRTAEYMSHGEAVVSCLSTPEDLTDFIQLWRRHFIDTMQPQYIHPAWGVDRGKSELRDNYKELRNSPSDSSSPSPRPGVDSTEPKDTDMSKAT